MNERGETAWKRFWERGGWWKGVVVGVGYFIVFQLGALAIGSFAAPMLSDSRSPEYVFYAYVLPIAWGGLVLVLFASSLGWLRELFARQPIRGSWWMWIAVAIVLGFNVLRFATIDYGSAGFGFVAMWLLAGLCIGFAEELLTRGIVVTLMRKAGHREIAVALVSAAVFSAIHAGNLLSGQDLFTTLMQLLYTFGFGLCMYLALRATGNLLWPILLHASTDPSIFLQSSYPVDSPVAAIASAGNLPVIVFGLVAIVFIRGRVAPSGSVGSGIR